MLTLVSSSSYIIQKNPKPSLAEVKSATPLNLPMPIEMLGQGARAPTSEELAKEQQYNLQQIALAGEWLQARNEHQRIVGVEQLNAYPLPEAEHLLLVALQLDIEPRVRSAAAQSLGMFKVLSDHAIDGLLIALKDTDHQTRMAVLDTLLSYCTRINMDNTRFLLVLGKLTQNLQEEPLNKDISFVLQAFVDDQKPINKAFLPKPQAAEKVN